MVGSKITYKYAGSFRSGTKRRERFGCGLLGSKLIEANAQNLAYGRNDRFNAAAHASRTDERKRLIFLGFLKRGPYESLPGLNVTEESVEEGLRCWGPPLGERSEVLSSIPLAWRLRQIECQKRSPVLT